jgi:hypothetical protein
MFGLAGYRRKHGWQRPYHPLQIATWVLFPLFVALFYGVCIPNLNTVALQAGLGAVTGVLAVVTGFLAFKATVIDPAAQILSANDQSDHAYCNLCRVNVPDGSLHCRECNKW